MQNFDYLSKIRDMQTLHQHCSDAEKFQLVAPEKSVVSARKALEFWAKLVYYTNGWDIPQHAGLMELISDADFVEYVDDAQVMNDIHFIRRIGNQGAHGQSINRKESLHCVASLYAIIGEWLTVLGEVRDLPPFDMTLVPKVVTLSVVTPDSEPVVSADTIHQRYAKESEGKHLHVEPPRVLSEAETRRIFIDLMLREAGWDVLTTNGALLAGKACIEVPLAGMPNNANEGFADYVLFSDDMKPLAVIEAKRTTIDPYAGKHQAALYADALERQYGLRPVVYYTNGFHTFVQDGLGYPDREVFSFHTQKDLELLIQKRTRRDISDLRVDTNIAGRDYQIQAIHSICNHLNSKHRRGLLVMATGTGKTRVSIGLTDVLIRNNWVKNILFLADRRSLVKQAHKNYRKLLRNETTTILSEDREPDMNARIMFSTYQTMIRYIDADEKKFSVGRFDLIIIDEAHRSVFGKYGTIFDYFDSLLIGLTATPREDVDRSTYNLLHLDEGEPNFAYELDEAIRDGYLVGYRVFRRSSKIMTEGAKYDQLTKYEKETLERVWDYEKARKALDPDFDYKRDIEGSEIYSYLFNIDTIDQVLQDLMTNGLRIEDGTTVGKSIIFAYNHKHAVQIVERFHALYPQLGEDYCVLIDNQVNYGQDLIDIFSTPRDETQKHIQIVVSVDMMDTGIDVPDCLNLVFFKQVRSKIKFNQMIGRGTRLCPDVFGEGKDKREFFIFDYCGNFEYFSQHPQGAEPMQGQTLNERLFCTRLDLAVILQDGKYQADESLRLMCEQLKDILHAQICTLNENHIAVRKEWERVQKYKNRGSWQYVSEVEAQGLRKHIAPLIFTDDKDFAAKKFDILCLLEQLSLVDNTVDGTRPMEKICSIAQLLEHKASIPQVQNCLPVIREVQSAVFWETVHTNIVYGLDNLERVRTQLRDLAQYIISGNGDTFEINLKDTITDLGEAQPLSMPMSYRQRVLDYLDEHTDHPVLQKIYTMEQLTEVDIRELERIFWQEIGTKEEYTHAYEHQERFSLWGGHIAAFLRSVIGIDRKIAREKYIELIQSGTSVGTGMAAEPDGNIYLTQEQEEYLNDILNYVCINGDITRETMATQPFSEFQWQPVFADRLTALVNYVGTLHRIIVA